MIRINIKDVQRGNQILMWDIADRLDRRYAQHVRKLAREVGVTVGRKPKRELIDEIAAVLATGDYPATVIKWRLHD